MKPSLIFNSFTYMGIIENSRTLCTVIANITWVMKKTDEIINLILNIHLMFYYVHILLKYYIGDWILISIDSILFTNIPTIATCFHFVTNNSNTLNLQIFKAIKTFLRLRWLFYSISSDDVWSDCHGQEDSQIALFELPWLHFMGRV